jgi:hypothetical protein
MAKFKWWKKLDSFIKRKTGGQKERKKGKRKHVGPR